MAAAHKPSAKVRKANRIRKPYLFMLNALYKIHSDSHLQSLTLRSRNGQCGHPQLTGVWLTWLSLANAFGFHTCVCGVRVGQSVGREETGALLGALYFLRRRAGCGCRQFLLP